MKRLYLTSLLLWSLLLVHQAARADGVTHLALDETFDVNSGTGGRDGAFSGQIASSNIRYDLEGWIGNTSSDKVYGAKNCLKFGTSSATGTCTTPEITLIGTGKTATLTFNAAGWGSGNNTLTITANKGVTLSGDTNITLTNSSWTAYTVNITVTTAESIQLTFSGKRGFLDDVKVEETVTAINAPSLPEEHLFWANTTEVATKHVTLIPADSTTVYYTTDGTEPSPSNGNIAMLTSNISITGTTTVKAKAYYKTVASSLVSRTYMVGETVENISGFISLGDENEARIYFSDDENNQVRVLYYDESSNQLFLRDNTGTLCLDLGTTAKFNPTPQYNQHIGGWIIGKRNSANGMPKLVATENTTTDYLVIANRVMEQQVKPQAIGNDELGWHLADWVTISEQRIGEDIEATDVFAKGAYDGALADLSGIVLSSGDSKQIAPISQNGIPAVVYVIDDSKEFVSPTANIENATVRLKRTLSSSNWNTFAVPFDMATMEGTIREYDHADGASMVFKNASSIEAGKPYLVKPTADVANPTYSNITLSATPAQSIEDGDYGFVAIYSPTDLATDKTEQFLKTDGKLYYPTNDGTRLRGLRAYFKTPTGQNASLFFIDDADLATGISNMNRETVTDNSYYNLNGQRVATPRKGLYIVNGKKLIIH